MAPERRGFPDERSGRVGSRKPAGALLLLLTVVFPMALLAGGCREAELRSAWRSGEIVVDGLYRDWSGPLAYYEKPSMFMGFRNDDENLYVIVKTVDRRAQLKVMRLGLTVWIEPPGHPERAWAIHYPVGLEEHGIPLFGADAPGKPDQEQQAKINAMLGTMELLGPAKNSRVEIAIDRPGDTDYGIWAAVRDTSDVIVYELRIPLRGDESRPHAAWAMPGERIGLRFATGDIRVRDTKEPERRDPNRDTTTGKIQYKGRDPEQERERDLNRRRMPQMMNPLTEPIEFQAEVTLAAKAAGSE